MGADPLRDLRARMPEGAVSTDPDVLASRGHDSWALALLRATRGEPAPLPRAVVFPASTDDVSAALRWANEARIAVVPRGAGSGVCGGAQALDGSIVLDLSRLDRIHEVSAGGHWVRTQTGVLGPELERAVGRAGLTVGHSPQSFDISTVGGWIAASSAGQASAAYGAIEDLVLGLTVVLANGDVLDVKATPRSAAGPDLRRLFVGSEGTLGVVAEATLTCFRAPPGHVWECFRFDDPHDMFPAAVEVAQADTGAAFVRGYDEADAALNFAALGLPAGSSVLLVGFASDLPGLDERRRAALDGIDARRRPERADPSLGERWMEHRNDAVELYRRIMGPDQLFGPNVIVDTMEVAGLYETLPDLHANVLQALTTYAEMAGCHLSHVYPSGSSLYFTFLIRGSDVADAERRYLAAWDDAADACFATGGTITHHHGVGRLKTRFMERELGPTGVEVLRSIKRALDPNGILNPGVLLP